MPSIPCITFHKGNGKAGSNYVSYSAVLEVAEGFMLLQRCLHHATIQLALSELELILGFCLQACEHPQVRFISYPHTACWSLVSFIMPSGYLLIAIIGCIVWHI